jgi:hypothetical protein
MTAHAHRLDAPLAAVSDFPDVVPPLVVKELRRMLRSVFFVVPFAALPAALGLVGLWVVAQETTAQAGGMLANCLWYAVVIPFYVLKPAQALFALRTEKRGTTLDLLLLCQTPSRIVLGKWLALELQALLYLAALLPFFVLQYFVGRVELVGVAFALVITVLGGAFVTVLCLAMSTFGRVLFWICLGLMLLFLPILALPAFVLAPTISGAAGGLSFTPIMLIPLLVGLMITGMIGFLAYAIATGNVGPLPTSRYQRAMALQSLQAPASPPAIAPVKSPTVATGRMP